MWLNSALAFDICPDPQGPKIHLIRGNLATSVKLLFDVTYAVN